MSDKLRMKLIVFFNAYGKKNTDLLDIYYEYLSSQDEEQIVRAIDDIILNGFDGNRAYFPKIAEIVGSTKQVSCYEIHSKWEEFKSKANIRYEKQEDWVYTLKKLLGKERIADMTNKEEPFIKKEFEELYVDLVEGKYELLENPNNSRLRSLPGGSLYLPGRG